MSDLTAMTLAAARDAIRAKKISSRELTAAFVAAIMSGKNLEAAATLAMKQGVFDLQQALRTDYLIDRYQSTYFVIDSFDQLMRDTAPDFKAIYERVRALPALAP